MSKKLVPKKVLKWLEKTVHKDVYAKILKLQKSMMKNQGYQSNFALVKAAETYGINPRELLEL